jgi:hypothetical protein
MSLTFFIHLPMKMEPIRSSETSAIKTHTLGNYPKRNILQLKHGESLKTREKHTCSASTTFQGHHTKIFQVEQLNRVIAYCRRFINCRYPKANWQKSTLSTQDLDQALNCCVKMVHKFLCTSERTNGTTRGCSQQFSKHCIQPTSCSLQHTSFFITNGKGAGLLRH